MGHDPVAQVELQQASLGRVERQRQPPLAAAQRRVRAFEGRRPLAHPILERGVRLAKLGFHGPSARDLGLQGGVFAAQLVGARQGDEARQERPEHHGDHGGDHGRRELHEALQPVGRVPEGDELHEVRRAAAQDEEREQGGEPAVLEVRPAADEDQDRRGDRVVGGRDEPVGHGVDRDEVGAPEQAIAVRQERRCPEQVLHHLTHLTLKARRGGTLLTCRAAANDQNVNHSGRFQP